MFIVDHEKVSKMKKLLEILTTPGQRITMDTLLKCEAVLEKLDMVSRCDTGGRKGANIENSVFEVLIV